MNKFPKKIDLVIKRIRAFKETQKWSRNKLSTESGVPWSTVKGIDNPAWNPCASTLRALEEVIPDNFDITN